MTFGGMSLSVIEVRIVLLHPQEPAIVPYSEPGESGSHSETLLH